MQGELIRAGTDESSVELIVPVIQPLGASHGRRVHAQILQKYRGHCHGRLVDVQHHSAAVLCNSWRHLGGPCISVIEERQDGRPTQLVLRVVLV